MKQILVALSLFVLLSGCTTSREFEPLPTTDRIALDRFMGKWYVIAAIPTVLERSPHKATVTFERADRGIGITYQFLTDRVDGNERTITARAMVDNPGINTDWDITYAWPFGTDLRIIHMEPDYSVTVLANPDRKKVWILSRQSDIYAPLYSDLILRLQQLGFNVGKIRRIPQ